MGKILVSDEQKRMWTICKMNPGATWTEVIYKRYKGRVNRKHLVNTLDSFIKKQTQLTMVFCSDNGQVYQRQKQYNGIDKYYFEVSLKQSDKKEEEAVEILNKCQNYEFDIENGPLYKFGLVCLSESEYIMIHMFHHMIYDAYSLGVFWKTFSSLYNDETIDVCSYLRYMEEKTLNEEKQLNNRKFWIKQLKRTSTENISLCGEEKLRNKEKYIAFYVNPEKIAAINMFALRNRVSPLAIYISSLFVLIHKYSCKTDLCIGTVFSGRRQMLYRNTIGNFSKVLPIIYEINADDSAEKLIQKVDQVINEVYDNQDTPLSEIMHFADIERKVDEHPLFQILFNRVVTSKYYGRVLLNGVEEVPYEVKLIRNENKAYEGFKISISMNEREENSVFHIWYNDVYKKEFIEYFFNDFINVISIILNDTNDEINKIPIVSPKKKWLRNELIENRTDSIRKEDNLRCIDGKKGDFKTNDCILDGYVNILQKMWKKYLGIELFDINDNFFECGGDSLTIVLMNEELLGKYNIETS